MDGPTPSSVWAAQIELDGLLKTNIKKEKTLTLGVRNVRVDLGGVKGRTQD